jgi:hypothetical protein
VQVDRVAEVPVAPYSAIRVQRHKLLEQMDLVAVAVALNDLLQVPVEQVDPAQLYWLFQPQVIQEQLQEHPYQIHHRHQDILY